MHCDGKTYTAQLPLLLLSHPSRLTRRQLNVVHLGGIELHMVELVGLDEASADRRDQKRGYGGFGELHLGVLVQVFC